MLTRMMGVALALATVTLFLVGAFAADPPAKRLPVPESAAREKALATVRDLFKSDIDKAKTPEEQLALSDKLRKTATETKDDPIGRFVLWQFAVETATKQGDLKAAFFALDEIARDYEVDELSTKSKTFATLAPKITIKNFPDVVPLASALIGRAVGEDRYDIAKTIGEPLNSVAQKFGDAATKKDLNLQLAEVRRLEKAHGDAAVALKTLETNPTDPAANLTVGKYQIDKGDWDAALSYLTLSEEAQFKDIAAKELAQPKDVGERIAIADEWWSLGEADKTPRKSRLQGHAVDLYTAALPTATGLTKKKIETRLAEAAKIPKSPLDISFVPGSRQLGGKDAKNISNSIGLKLNLIPAGEFLMGASEAETKVTGKTDELQHRVKITKPFYMGVFPVTRGQFAQFATADKYQAEAEKDGRGSYGYDANGTLMQSPQFTWRTPGLNGSVQTDDHPVVSVSWNDAVAFCDWLSKKESKKYRLPTEAEWEYACRAGTKTVYNFGDWLNGTQANCNGSTPFPSSSAVPVGPFLKGTTKVGSYKANAAGLFDMHGNVAQWCSDAWDSSYYTNSPTDDPQGPATNLNSYRCLRGGNWRSPARDCRSASRYYGPPRSSYYFFGFRVVLDIPEKTSPTATVLTPTQPSPPTTAKSPATPAPPQTPPPTTPAAKPDTDSNLQFTKWVYSSDERGRPGYFKKDGTGWVEMKEGELFGQFKESERTTEYIELLDETRNLWVRIDSKQASWSKDHEKWYVSAKGSPAEEK